MQPTLLEGFFNKNVSVVAYKHKTLKRALIKYLNSFSNASVAELNSELNVMLGGTPAQTEDLISLPFKSVKNKYSLSLVNNDIKLMMSKLGNSQRVVRCPIAGNNLFSSLAQINNAVTGIGP